MFVDLDAALPANGTPGTTHDFLDIIGNASGTPTKLFLAEFDDAVDTGTPTTGNGIHVIDVGGTTTPGAFIQGNALTAGAYQYVLRYVAAENGYFLQSAVRDEMSAHPAALSASQAIVRHCFRDDQRVPDSPKGATYGRAWFGYHKGASNFGADTGIDMDLDFSCSTGGMDWRMGYGWFAGVAGGFGSGNIDLTVPSGPATMDGDARVIEAYAAYTSSSFFINLSAGYSDMDWAFSGVLLQTDPTSVSGLIASAQAGFALDLDLIAVKLFGALNYDDSSCGDNCFNYAVTEDTGLVEAKGTVRFDGVASGGSIRPWASVSFSDVLSDGTNTVSVGAVSASSDTNQALLSLDAGLQAYLDENFALFADGGYHESLSKDISGYKAGAGLKLYW
jgi:outer membrane autotransporter protein